MGLFGPAYPVLREVIVNLKGGESVFRGILWARKGGYLVLREARLLSGRGEPVAVDGEVLVPAVNVEFMQVV